MNKKKRSKKMKAVAITQKKEDGSSQVLWIPFLVFRKHVEICGVITRGNIRTAILSIELLNGHIKVYGEKMTFAEAAERIKSAELITNKPVPAITETPQPVSEESIPEQQDHSDIQEPQQESDKYNGPSLMILLFRNIKLSIPKAISFILYLFKSIKSLILKTIKFIHSIFEKKTEDKE